ncbi:MAG TPA: glycosyltransferase family 39 protein [Candidatus Udaeobacter sp.]|nr:glycosyltransferase family 39 protein [Candidatus Udaeobacter sp.]
MMLLEDRRTLWIVAALIVVLFAVANLPWQLDDYDQAKQAFTSFEMVKEGHWVYQHTPHERIATKPPLVGWISAALFAVTRSWEIAWRLPSLIAALALAVVLYSAAKEAYGRIAAVIAVGAFGLNLLSPRLATLVRTDMPLALLIFLIGLLIWQKIREGNEWKRRDRLYVFFLLTAAMLIKGPIVYAFLLPGIALFQVRRGRVRSKLVPSEGEGGAPKATFGSAWPGYWPWIASLAIFLVWVASGIRFQPGFYEEVVMREFVGRFGETIHRPQPFLFYLPHLLHKFAPWSVLIIVIAIFDLRLRNWRLRSVFHEMSPEIFWLLCWSIGGLIMMSLIPSKRVDRIFPVIPPLCLLLAAQIAPRNFGSHGPAGRSSTTVESEETPHREVATTTALARFYQWSAVALVFAIFFTGAYTGWKVITGYRNHRDALAVFGRDIRHQAEARHWRYEVVSAKDEGLLLYLHKTNFIEPADAVTEWNNESLDALVVSKEKVAVLMRDLKNTALSQLQSNEREQDHQGRGYVLIAR